MIPPQPCPAGKHDRRGSRSASAGNKKPIRPACCMAIACCGKAVCLAGAAPTVRSSGFSTPAMSCRSSSARRPYHFRWRQNGVLVMRRRVLRCRRRNACRPTPLRIQRHGRDDPATVEDSASGNDGHFDIVHNLRPQRHGADMPGVAAASVPCAMMASQPACSARIAWRTVLQTVKTNTPAS